MTNDDLKSQGNVVPFGKHKGRLIEELLVDDPSYLEWLSGQPWFREKFVTLHQVIINRGAEPEETPEHNALQVLFLDDEECMKLLRAVEPDCDARVVKELNEARDDKQARIAESIEHYEEELLSINKDLRLGEDQDRKDDDYWLKGVRARHAGCVKKLADLRGKQELLHSPIEVAFHIWRTFEAGGVDVVLSIDAKSPTHGIESRAGTFNIEIKPVVGDDYPAVLRQIRASRSNISHVHPVSNVLFLERYVGVGATREQFIRIFASAGILVVFRERTSGAAP